MLRQRTSKRQKIDIQQVSRDFRNRGSQVLNLIDTAHSQYSDSFTPRRSLELVSVRESELDPFSLFDCLYTSEVPCESLFLTLRYSSEPCCETFSYIFG